MAYFFIRIGVYTVAAAIVMNLVPGLRLAPYAQVSEPLATILAYLRVGLIFGMLHSFVRPVILFLTGRLYIWSMGLLALVIDTFIFLIFSYVAPAVWLVGGSRLFSAALGALLMGVVVVSLEALLGFDAPPISAAASGDRRTPFYWRWLGLLPTGRRNRVVENLRTQQMIYTIQSYGIDILIGLSPLRGFRRGVQKLTYRRRPRLTEDSPAVKLRLMLQELGPTFVKFGQMTAGRIEMLPDEWRVELERLQDDVKPFPFIEVQRVIQQELGGPPEAVFAAFSERPLAAASTGQVHAATLHSGETVIVKVRRPNIDVIVKGDLNVMQDVIDTAERRLSWVRRFGLSVLFREFAENVVRELDYANEADQARLLRYNMRSLALVHVPVIYGAYSTSKVLTQERMDGVKISDVAALDAAGLNREEVAQHFFRALLQQVLLDGFFHADLHPGNVWVNLRTGRLVFLDMGMVGRLTRLDRITMGELIWSLQDHDSQALSRVLVSICHVAQGYDSTAFQYDVERLVNRYLVLEGAAPGLQAIISDLGGLLLRYGLQLRKEFTLAFKAMGQGESIMRTLLGDKPPDYIISTAYATLKDALLAQLTPQNVTQQLIKPFARDVTGRLPVLLTAASALLDDFQRGQSPLQINPNSIDQRVRTVQAALEVGIRRVVLSVLLVGLLLGSTLLLLVPFEGKVSQNEALVLRLVAEFGFVAAALLIVAMVINTLWQSTKNSKQF